MRNYLMKNRLMKGILLLLFLVCGLIGIAQDKSTYFAKNGSQVNDLNDAAGKIVDAHFLKDDRTEVNQALLNGCS